MPKAAIMPPHLGLGAGLHRRGRLGLPLGQAGGDHPRARPARAAHHLERLVELAALGQLQGPQRGAPVGLAPPEGEALHHHGEGHDRAGEQRDHDGTTLGERLDERTDL
jgi:hypothetical protein